MPKKPAPRPIDPNIRKFLNNHVGANDSGDIVFDGILLEPAADGWDDGIEEAHMEGWKADLALILQSYLDGWSKLNVRHTSRKLPTGIPLPKRKRDHHRKR